MDKVIQKQLALLKFAILPGILGGIACFIGPPHSALIKANIGVVIGFALQGSVSQSVSEVSLLKLIGNTRLLNRGCRKDNFDHAKYPKRKLSHVYSHLF